MTDNPMPITNRQWRALYRQMLPHVQEIEMRTRGGYKHGAPDNHIDIPLSADQAGIIHKAADDLMALLCQYHERQKTRDFFKRFTRRARARGKR